MKICDSSSTLQRQSFAQHIYGNSLRPYFIPEVHIIHFASTLAPSLLPTLYQVFPIHTFSVMQSSTDVSPKWYPKVSEKK